MRTRWILWIIHAIKLSQNKRIKEPRAIVRHSEHKSRNTTSFESCKFPFFHPSMVVGQGKIKSLAFIYTKGHSLIKFHWFYIAVRGWSTLKTKQNKTSFCVEEMAQSRTCLSCKHGDLSWTPGVTLKSQVCGEQFSSNEEEERLKNHRIVLSTRSQERTCLKQNCGWTAS